jgi:predicted nucleotidyltransferase
MKRIKFPKKEQYLIEESNTQRILDVVFTYPNIEFSLTELAMTANVAKSAASRIVPQIAERNVVTIKNLGILHRICANTESFEYIKRKIAWNLNCIYRTDLIEFLNEQYNHPKAIVLFGSFRLGQDLAESDIDIAIETAQDISPQTLRMHELHLLEQELHRTIQIHLFNRKNIDENVFANIVNGIVLFGYLEVKK